MAIESLPMGQPLRPVSQDKKSRGLMRALEAAHDIAEETVKKSTSPRRNIDIGPMHKGAQSVESGWHEQYGDGRHRQQKWWPSDTTGKVEDTHRAKRALTDQERQEREERGQEEHAPQKPEPAHAPSQDAATALAYRGKVGSKHTPEAVRRMIREWNESAPESQRRMKKRSVKETPEDL